MSCFEIEENIKDALQTALQDLREVGYVATRLIPFQLMTLLLSHRHII